jgi:hypothetical protein
LRRFVLFGIGRSGTAATVDLLNSCNLVRCDPVIPSDLRADPIAAMHSLAREAELSDAKAYGLRLLVPHLLENYSVSDVPGFVRFLDGQGWKIINVRRSSRARVIVSFMHAELSIFHLTEGDGPWRFRPFTASRKDLERWRDAVSEWADIEQRALEGVESYEVVYERDLADDHVQQATAASLVRRLTGTQPGVMHTKFIRQIPDIPLSEVIVNYDEIQDILTEPAVSGNLGRGTSKHGH